MVAEKIKDLQIRDIFRVGSPELENFVIEQDLTANQIKLFLGLHYLASLEPDIYEGPNKNIIQDGTLAWKQINCTNWTKAVEKMGFNPKKYYEVQRDLDSVLTQIPQPSYRIFIDGEPHWVEYRGVSVVQTKKICHEKSGRVREYIIKVGGYDAIMHGYWNSLASSILYSEEPVSRYTWKFIAVLSSAIRSKLKEIQRKIILQRLRDFPQLNFFPLNWDNTEEKMGVEDLNIERKRKAWQDALDTLNKLGLLRGAFLPEGYLEKYGIEKRMAKINPNDPSAIIKWPDKALKQLKYLESSYPRCIYIELTRGMLAKWLPIDFNQKHPNLPEKHPNLPEGVSRKPLCIKD